VNKGGKRFLVGHVCGRHIYGANFEVLKKDYEAAIVRQDVLRRVREVRGAADPFLRWVETLSKSDVFRLYEDLRAQFQRKMPWLWNELEQHTNNVGGYFGGLKLPETLFDGFTDPQRGFKEAAAEISRSVMLAVGKIEIDKDVGGTLGRLQLQVGRVEQVVRQLAEVEAFFQPAILGKLCELATARDRKRQYRPGLMSITCIREKGPTTIRVPTAYKVPDTAAIVAFRAAVSNLSSK
jgi:hypothetical protein